MQWTKDTPVIIYGASHRGGLLFDRLNIRNCNVICFIDKRADEIIEHKGLKVYNINSNIFNEYYSCAIVIICVANIFEHERIVMELIRNGFKYLIFCPVNGSSNTYRNNEERKNMIELYEILAENYDFNFPVEIHCTKGMFHPEIGSDIIISTRDDRIIVPIPVPFVFSRGTKNTINQIDNSVLLLFQIVELYNYFSGDSESSYLNYININCKYFAHIHGIKTSQSWIDNILLSRRESFEQMNLNHSLNPSFSTLLSVNGTWNKSKFHFNMVSGKHRAAFLIYMKKSFIPLAITNTDYIKYKNDNIAKKLYNFINTSKIVELPYPLYHPYFLRMYSCPYSYFFLMFQQFILAFFKVYLHKTLDLNIKNINVLSLIPELEPISQMLSKIGLNVNCSYKPNKFDKLVRNLYYLNNMNVVSDKYNLVLCNFFDYNKYNSDLYIFYINDRLIKNIYENNNFNIYFKHRFKNKIFIFASKDKIK